MVSTTNLEAIDRKFETHLGAITFCVFVFSFHIIYLYVCVESIALAKFISSMQISINIVMHFFKYYVNNSVI